MAGSIALSLTQRYDNASPHAPLDGGLLYFYAAGTTTPQSAYQDISLTIPWPNPITLDSGGNVPQLFFADGYIKFRLANSAGVTQIAADYVLVLGPTAGSGAAPSVDATTILGTGDLKVKYGTGSVTGFVRANGRTIGSATSGASELANASAQALFEYLWAVDANLTVSTGRGASANADWTANKNIALPDWRGRTIFGLDDMGNSAAGRLTASYFGTAATVLGAAGGSESKVLVTGNLPPYTPAGSIANGAITISNPTVPNAGAFSGNNNGGGGGAFGVIQGGPATITASQASSSFTGTAQGGASTPVAVASPGLLATIYIKL